MLELLLDNNNLASDGGQPNELGLPDIWGRFPYLERLDLSANPDLRGILPMSLAELTDSGHFTMMTPTYAPLRSLGRMPKNSKPGSQASQTCR